MMNNDQPGVIGAVGTALGRAGVNIANFALGRNENGAVGVVSVDDADGKVLTRELIEEIRALPSIKHAWAVRV
jgi:D-3-phosphoglycerate dehydrogenase